MISEEIVDFVPISPVLALAKLEKLSIIYLGSTELFRRGFTFINLTWGKGGKS